MIQIDNLCLSYSGIPLLEDVSFTVNKKERCGLVGRNGSGKTTLLKLLMKKIEADEGFISIAKGYRIGYLDQHISFTAKTIIEEAILGLPEEERENVYKAEKILFGLGFQEMNLERSPSELSGGYQLRLHLAKLLLSEANCLLLDEPTNYLDIISMRFLARLLKRWEGEFILISHDREFMDSVTTHTLGVHRKKVRKIEGTSIDFFNQLVEEEEIYEKTRVNLEKKKAQLQSYIDRFGAKATKAKQAQSRKKALGRIPALEALTSLHNLDFHFREKTYLGKKQGEIENICFTYDLKKEMLIRNFSLSIEKGERIAIIGKNGYGKSTILRLLAKELLPNSGVVNYSEAVAIGYFGQTNIERLNKDNTIEEEIALQNPHLTYADVRSIAGQMMFSGELAKKKIGVLSGGEKSRVLLGKILGKPCNLLLLDEPTHHLDIESVEALTDALETFSETFIIVTHSELILKRLHLDKLIICHQDRQEVFLGEYEEFLEKKGWEEEKTVKEEKKKSKTDEIRRQELKLIQKEIQKIEEKIVKLEKEQTKEEATLAKYAESREVTKILEIVRSTKEREKEITFLYEKLEELERNI